MGPNSDDIDINPTLGPALGTSEAAAIGVDGLGYLSPASSPATGQTNLYPGLTGRVQGHYSGDLLEVSGQAEGVLEFVPSSPFGFDAAEAYIGTKADLPFHLRLGRKLEEWNRLDDQWQLGIWQPRFRWDVLHPETDGLTGLFADYTVPGFPLRVVGYWSPIFIPDRGMPISEEGGGFFSTDRFYNPPASSAIALGQTLPVNYNLQTPPLSQIVAQKSAGGMIQLGGKTGAFISAAYAYQPINQILFSYQGYEDPLASDVDVSLYPFIAYHHLTSVDLGYSDMKLSNGRSPLFLDAWFSYLGDNPDSIAMQSPMTYEDVVASQAESVTVALKSGPSKNPTLKMDMSYLHQTGGNAPDVGPQAMGAGSVFEPRYPYQDAVSGSIAAPLPRALLRGLSASTKLIYDIGHQGTIWSTEIDYKPLGRSPWRLRIGADVLSSAENTAASDFISAYRADDRVFSGVSYVF